MASKAAAQKTQTEGEDEFSQNPIAEAVSETIDGEVETREHDRKSQGVRKTTTAINLADALAQKENGFS